ncbi:hypothetical protein A2U01_0079556, partial [Trifolium medium]|nr:hypothetical protein [Trifolium medium]
MLKMALKKWNFETYVALATRIPALVAKIEVMELKGEAGELLAEDVKMWKDD